MITKYVVWDTCINDYLEKPKLQQSNEEYALNIFLACIFSIMSIPMDILLSPIEIWYLLILHIVNKKRPKERI